MLERSKFQIMLKLCQAGSARVCYPGLTGFIPENRLDKYHRLLPRQESASDAVRRARVVAESSIKVREFPQPFFTE